GRVRLHLDDGELGRGGGLGHGGQGRAGQDQPREGNDGTHAIYRGGKSISDVTYSRGIGPQAGGAFLRPPSRPTLGMAGLLRLSSKASNPGDLNSPLRELALSWPVGPDTRRPPVTTGPRGLKRLHGPRGAATL